MESSGSVDVFHRGVFVTVLYGSIESLNVAALSCTVSVHNNLLLLNITFLANITENLC